MPFGTMSNSQFNCREDKRCEDRHQLRKRGHASPRRLSLQVSDIEREAMTVMLGCVV